MATYWAIAGKIWQLFIPASGHTGCLAFDISIWRTAVAQWIRLELPSPEITLGSVQD